MKKKLQIYIPLFLTILSTLILSLSFTIWCPQIQSAPETIVENDNGCPLTAISISDLEELNRIEYANYTPNEFVYPQRFTGEKIHLDNHTALASRGTLSFIFLNLDPTDVDFHKKSEALSPYLQGDQYWHFTLYLPAFFSAANIYVKSILTEQIGQIEDYDFIEYSEYEKKTEVHKSTTQPQYIDLRFYSQRRALDSDLSIRGLVLTIHYEAKPGSFVGFKDSLILGKEDRILKMTNSDEIFLISISILAIIVAAMLSFACLMKKNLSILPNIITNLGISGYALGTFLLSNYSATPYFLLMFLPTCIFLVVLGVILSNKFHFKKFPIWIVLVLLSLIFGITMIMAYISPSDQNLWLQYFYRVISVITSLTIFSTSIISFSQNKNPNKLLIPLVTTVFLFFFTFSHILTPQIHSVSLWLLGLILCISTVSAFWFFIQLEQRNQYLTNNLQFEVVKQTQSLKGLLDERDKLLRYLSHDMKKPIASIKRFITDLNYSEEDSDRSKKLQITLKKISDVEADLVGLQRYAKNSYNKEESVVLDITEILKMTFEALNPDCEANNIHLHYNVIHDVYAYAKKDTLISVLNNLIMNAIEHSSCSNIYIKTAKNISKGLCKILIMDDGIGLPNIEDAMEPYRSLDSQKENMGLGLYMCKEHLSTMDGTLEYSRINNKTIFTIILHLA